MTRPCLSQGSVCLAPESGEHQGLLLGAQSSLVCVCVCVCTAGGGRGRCGHGPGGPGQDVSVTQSRERVVGLRQETDGPQLVQSSSLVDRFSKIAEGRRS